MSPGQGPAPVSLTEPRVLDLRPVPTLDAYVAEGGGDGLKWALSAGPDAVVEVVDASGLAGRGGAGFPTGRKWRTIRGLAAGAPVPTTVVVNAAEGEPGTFKDRAILRANPYRVLEGALVAAHAVGADEVVVATKARFHAELARIRAAIAELRSAGWTDIASIDVIEGPDEYLFGEETALLEVVDGRPPLPRIAPPWRLGLDTDAGSRDPAEADLVDVTQPDAAPPVLVDNVETLAHAAMIAARGADWFRSVGDADFPGTIVCTLTGTVGVTGVVEVATGTPLADVVTALAEGRSPREVAFALPGVSNPILPGSALGTPLTHAAMQAAGSGLGTAGFILFDESVDPLRVAYGASRFLAVESCGQCTPCKQDGLAVAEGLRILRRPSEGRPAAIGHRLETITFGARCNLATQHQVVVRSLLSAYPGSFLPTDPGGAVEPFPVVEILDLVQDEDGARVTLDAAHLTKQPDWTHEAVWSGEVPAERA